MPRWVRDGKLLGSLMLRLTVYVSSKHKAMNALMCVCF